jgi:sucrose-6-phosphate hydrolase SacC (GH32 family)
MMVVKNGETYYMFAEGKDDQAQLLTSRDGVRWQREGQLDIRYTNGQPLTAGPYGTPTAWLEDKTWYLFYERSDQGVWLAKSTDLKVWTNVQDEPVLSLGPEPYDKLMIAMNQVIRYGERYYAYYHGSGTAEKPRLWTTNVAVSTDLVHWKKFAGNPLVPERDNKSSGIIVHDGKQFRLYTMHPEVNVHFRKSE